MFVNVRSLHFVDTSVCFFHTEMYTYLYRMAAYILCHEYLHRKREREIEKRRASDSEREQEREGDVIVRKTDDLSSLIHQRTFKN